MDLNYTNSFKKEKKPKDLKPQYILEENLKKLFIKKK